MNSLVRSKARQQSLGEVFTPDFLVQRMLAMVPEELWNDPSKTFLEPSCGNGNFVIAIIRRKLEHGSTIEQALSTTFGVDIMEDNIKECKERIFDEFLMFELPDEAERLMKIVHKNIIVADFLKPGTLA